MQYDEFKRQIQALESPVVVDVWAPWCAPCRAIEPALKRLQAVYQGRVEVWRINADENPEVVRALGVRGIPTLLVYRGGEEIARRIGSQSEPALEALFLSALSGEAPAPTILAAKDRLLRIFIGLALLAVAWQAGWSWLILLAAGVVLFSAVYDRCPIWRALSRGFAARVAGSSQTTGKVK